MGEEQATTLAFQPSQKVLELLSRKRPESQCTVKERESRGTSAGLANSITTASKNNFQQLKATYGKKPFNHEQSSGVKIIVKTLPRGPHWRIMMRPKSAQNIR